MSDTTRESVEALVEKLGKDVFYGEERLHKMRKHNPMHLDAIVTLRALLSELDAARTTLAAAEAREGELRRVLEPFDKMAGELFARNYDAPDVVLSFEPPEGETVALDFGDFLCVRDALKKGEGQ